MNSYLRDLFGQEVSAKDFRTWHATVLAAVGLAVSGHAPSSPSARKRAVSRVVSEVADYLGITSAVCRASYIDGRLIDRYLDGETVEVPLERLGAGVQPGWPATSGAFETTTARSRPPGHLGARRRSHQGVSSSAASRVKIANMDARRGSRTRSAVSIRSRVRCWQAGRLITHSDPSGLSPRSRDAVPQRRRTRFPAPEFFSTPVISGKRCGASRFDARPWGWTAGRMRIRDR